MDVDIKTIILTIGIFRLVMLFVFLYQFRAAKSVSGPGWWLLWSLAAILGSIVILLRNIPGFLPVAIITQNPLIATESMFIFLGLIAFFEKKPPVRIFIFAYSAYYLLHLFFWIIYDDINIRTLLLYTFMAVNTFLSAWCIVKNRTNSIKLTANLNAIILTIHGLIYSTRVVMITAGIHSPSMFEKSFPNYLFYFDGLVIGTMLAYGLIIMINQKLNSEISEAKDHFERIFNTTPDSVIIARLSDGRFVDCNESFLRFTGLSKDKLQETKDITQKMLADPEEAARLYSEISRKGYCENREIRYHRPDGTLGACLVNAVTIQLKGVPHGIALIHDITSRRLAEDRITGMNEILRKSNAEKDKLFSIISHDLINPFNSLMGLTEIMAEEGSDKPAGEMKFLAVTVNNTASALFGLLNNLLEWSRHERGLIPFKPERLNLISATRESLEPLAQQAGSKSISISCDIKPDATVTFDITAFKTIMRNLVSNAIKFTPNGGSVVIKSADHGDGFTEISVSDNGIGMPPEILENIFRIDARTNREGTDGEMSTGLGLLICRDFIEKGGGTIRAASKVNEGSEFIIRIPS